MESVTPYQKKDFGIKWITKHFSEKGVLLLSETTFRSLRSLEFRSLDLSKHTYTQTKNLNFDTCVVFLWKKKQAILRLEEDTVLPDDVNAFIQMSPDEKKTLTLDTRVTVIHPGVGSLSPCLVAGIVSKTSQTIYQVLFPCPDLVIPPPPPSPLL